MGAKAQVHIGKDVDRKRKQSYQGDPCLLRPTNHTRGRRTRQQACAAVPPKLPKIALANMAYLGFPGFVVFTPFCGVLLI
jgi:hypothetical protein